MRNVPFSPDTRTPVNVVVCVPLAVDPLPSIFAVATELGIRVDAQYPVDLLPRQRFVADHRGEPLAAGGADEVLWGSLLRAADVCFGYPRDSPDGLIQLHAQAPNLRWVQATSAGAGEHLVAANIKDGGFLFTSAAGIHAVPLAEFAIFGLLAMDKEVLKLVRASDKHEWLPRSPIRTLRGTRVLVVGLGGVGREVARLAQSFGAEVLGCRRDVSAPQEPGVTKVFSLAEVDRVLGEVDSVVITMPGTVETRGWLNARRIALLPRHAVVVNVGRGNIVDTLALTSALDSGALRGAVLDVADVEPLPSNSPLWGRDDVVLSPHTAALTPTEDERLLELFCKNLRLFLTHRPLQNAVDERAGY
jgi:glyoxylate/hydroxypyruvate reductase A